MGLNPIKVIDCFLFIAPKTFYPSSRSLPTYRTCEEPETEATPTLQPVYRIRRRGSGLVGSTQKPTTPIPESLHSQTRRFAQLAVRNLGFAALAGRSAGTTAAICACILNN